MACIFVLEDDEAMLRHVADWLAYRGHTVTTASSFAEVPESFSGFDLLIMDWELPDGEGVNLCRRLRQAASSVPVLMVTGRSGIDQKEVGYESGVDDYLTKPFEMKELEMRIDALLKRAGNAYNQKLEIQGLILDRLSHTVTCGETRVELNRMEFSILALLASHPNHAFSMETIISRLGGSDSRTTHAAIVTCVSRLKKKIPTGDELIANERGQGYLLRVGK